MTAGIGLVTGGFKRCKGMFLHSTVSSSQDCSKCFTLYFPDRPDLFNQTPSQLLWEASSHMQQLMYEGCSYTYPPLSIARSIVRKLEQCRVKQSAQGLTAAIALYYKSRWSCLLLHHSASIVISTHIILKSV